jgi:osmotically-inducible protein OsmY
MKSDTELQHHVLTELEWEPRVDAAQIGVTAHEGIVTLTGQVSGLAQKIAAEEVAKRVHGVKAVANDIAVQIPGSSQRSDTDVAAAAVSVLAWNTLIPDERITVTVRDGWITLEGTVDWQYQKEAAEQAVQGLAGARGVNDNISVSSKQTAPDLRERIEAALVRSATLDSKGIWVETGNGAVILRGDVHSCAEREAAERAAWAAPGVSRVVNCLEVTPW